MVEILFTDPAIDDLRRLGPDAVPKVLKKLLLLEENPEAGHPLGGDFTGFRKLVVGRNTWRIVYRVTDDKQIEVCEVWAVGRRADAQVYAETAQRLYEASEQTSVMLRLGAVLERLGKLSGTRQSAVEEPREPVPGWLADRLVHIVGMSREEVAALDLEKAVDLRADHRSRPR